MHNEDFLEFTLLVLCTTLGLLGGLYLAVALFEYCPSNVKQEITGQFHQLDSN